MVVIVYKILICLNFRRSIEFYSKLFQLEVFSSTIALKKMIAVFPALCEHLHNQMILCFNEIHLSVLGLYQNWAVRMKKGGRGIHSEVA